jgi:hypothetical protein
VDKKVFLTAAFILALFLMAMAEGCFVKVAQANPYTYFKSEHVSPPQGAVPLSISEFSPKNHSVYDVNDVALTFSVSTRATDINAINKVSFTASWLQEEVIVYKYDYSNNPVSPDFWSYDETFWDLPDGEYSVVITAVGGGSYVEGVAHTTEGTIYNFDMTTISVVNFTIATPPEVSVLSPLNMTYDSSDIQLNFTVSKEPSLTKYSIDGQENSTFYGNTTLTGLANGGHNITIYVWDVAGNLGVSESISFNIAKPESFPTSFIIAPVTSVAAIGIGILVYFRKRKS